MQVVVTWGEWIQNLFGTRKEGDQRNHLRLGDLSIAQRENLKKREEDILSDAFFLGRSAFLKQGMALTKGESLTSGKSEAVLITSLAELEECEVYWTPRGTRVFRINRWEVRLGGRIILPIDLTSGAPTIHLSMKGLLMAETLTLAIEASIRPRQKLTDGIALFQGTGKHPSEKQTCTNRSRIIHSLNELEYDRTFFSADLYFAICRRHSGLFSFHFEHARKTKYGGFVPPSPSAAKNGDKQNLTPA